MSAFVNLSTTQTAGCQSDNNKKKTRQFFIRLLVPNPGLRFWTAFCFFATTTTTTTTTTTQVGPPVYFNL
jgi:hypothetical protein